MHNVCIVSFAKQAPQRRAFATWWHVVHRVLKRASETLDTIVHPLGDVPVFGLVTRCANMSKPKHHHRPFFW